MKDDTDKKRRITIWTQAYRPFICGGDVHAPVATHADGQPLIIGRGFRGYAVKNPVGGFVIVEAKSGGIVGRDLKSIRRDVESASITLMRKQVREAVGKSKQAVLVEPDEFWQMYNRNRRD
jgi:hypothetical protein